MPIALPIWSTAITTVVIGMACVTDLRWRRIPNLMTFPAILVSLILHAVAGGWGGLLFALSGTIFVPVLLFLLHAGKGPGGGDIKLAAVIGANLGPLLGALAVLISAVAGGILAAVWMLIVAYKRKRTSPRPIVSDTTEAASGAGDSLGETIIPYGVALTFGSLTALVMYWIGGATRWLM